MNWKSRSRGKRKNNDLLERAIRFLICWLFGLLWRLIKKAWFSHFPRSACSSPGRDAEQKFYHSWEWRRLAYRVKQKHGWSCMACGRSRKDYPDLVIIADHIRPLKHFWHLRLEESNIQVLCDEDNMGKGSWDQTDYRYPLRNKMNRTTSESIQARAPMIPNNQ